MSEAGGPTPGVVTSAGGDSDRFPQPSWAISSYHPRSAGEEAEAQPVPLLVGPPRPPRASCLCAARPSLRPEETPARAELTVGQQGRALPGAPAAALPGPGMGVGYELGLRGQHQLSRWRPLGHDADLPLLDVPSSSLFLPPAPVVSQASRDQLPVAHHCSEKTATQKKLRDQEENAGPGGGRGGPAKLMAWIY